MADAVTTNRGKSYRVFFNLWKKKEIKTHRRTPPTQARTNQDTEETYLYSYRADEVGALSMAKPLLASG
jgi:hypothetical protein